MALDALRYLRGPNPSAWQNVFLKYHGSYLSGSKAPDTQFKDFRNHVIHVRDNYWGGAPKAAQRWYDQTVQFLVQRDWTNACYAAGVLSHYYMDPIQPFHTGQSEAETKIHRAAEWSINKSYDDLQEIALARALYPEIEFEDTSNWLEQAILAGAERANQHYETVVEHYDLRQGASDPPAGLDSTSRVILAELIAYATVGFARILERALVDSGVRPPHVTLSLHTYLATLQVPIQWIERKISDAHEREQIRAIYHEVQRTGKLVVHLPEESRVVRQQRAQDASSDPDSLHRTRAPRNPPRPVLKSRLPMESHAVVESQTLPPSEPGILEPDVTHSRIINTVAPQQASPVVDEPAKTSGQPVPSSTLRFYLETEAPVEEAPSIGKKTARRLKNVGIQTVADLLAALPEQLTPSLNTRWITVDVIRDWQDQAQLACQIPQIRGHDAQFLVAAGYRDVSTIASGTASTILDRIVELLETTAGQQILRGGTPPDLAEVTNWIDWASQARPLQAA